MSDYLFLGFLKRNTLHKICENTGFHWPVFSCVRTKSMILSLYGRIRVSENPYSRISYAAIVVKVVLFVFKEMCFLLTITTFDMNSGRFSFNIQLLQSNLEPSESSKIFLRGLSYSYTPAGRTPNSPDLFAHRLQHRRFPVNFIKNCSNNFFIEHL